MGLVAGPGADAVVEYGDPGWVGQGIEATAGIGPQVVFDGVGGKLGREVFEIFACGGRFSAYGAPDGSFTRIDPEETERRRVTVAA